MQSGPPSGRRRAPIAPIMGRAAARSEDAAFVEKKKRQDAGQAPTAHFHRPPAPFDTLRQASSIGNKKGGLPPGEGRNAPTHPTILSGVRGHVPTFFLRLGRPNWRDGRRRARPARHSRSSPLGAIPPEAERPNAAFPASFRSPQAVPAPQFTLPPAFPLSTHTHPWQTEPWSERSATGRRDLGARRSRSPPLVGLPVANVSCLDRAPGGASRERERPGPVDRRLPAGRWR